MGRICAVEGCRSGRNADIVKRKKLGVRRVSIFTVPKRNNALQAWSRAIGKNLSAKDAICEFHFPHNSLIKEDRTILRDGTVHIMPRQKYGLVPNAIPIAIAEQENIKPPEVSNRRNAFTVAAVNVPTVEISPEPVDSNAVVAPDVRTVEVVPVPVDANNVDDPEPEVSTAGIAPKPIDDPVNIDGFADHLKDTSSESSRADASFHCNEADLNDDMDELTQFLIENIFGYLARTPLPETWSWATNRREKNSIMFIKIDPYTYELAFRLTLYNDLSVKAHIPDGKVEIELASIVTSIKSLERLLDEMGKKIVCRGTGMKEESRDGSCSGFLVFKKFDKQVPIPRCNFCRKLRQKIQNRNNRRRRRLETRYARTKERANLKQEAYNHLREKGKRLRQKVIEANEKSAAIEEQKLDRAISHLPPVQQEAVRACFNASKLACYTQRRYTQDWVYECMLMRIKNNKLDECFDPIMFCTFRAKPC